MSDSTFGQVLSQLLEEAANFEPRVGGSDWHPEPPFRGVCQLCGVQKGSKTDKNGAPFDYISVQWRVMDGEHSGKKFSVPYFFFAPSSDGVSNKTRISLETLLNLATMLLGTTTKDPSVAVIVIEQSVGALVEIGIQQKGKYTNFFYNRKVGTAPLSSEPEGAEAPEAAS